jgi:hypothetical protein
LLIGKSGLFHSRYSPKLADFVPSLWCGREGEGQSGSPRTLTSSFLLLKEMEASNFIFFSFLGSLRIELWRA